MFWLTERFLSIQGEGRYTGVPSYFFRTGGCNLHCPGFGTKYRVEGEVRSGCDTYFAVDRSFAGSWEAVEDAEMLLSEMDREFEALGYLPHVVITGGEPLIYATDAVFNSVIEGLIRRGITVTFETNGTIAPDFERYPFYARCVYALSIKLSNSGEPYERRIVPGTLRSIAENARESFLKFTLDRQIVESGAAEQEIAQIRVMLPEAEVFCMPVGESRAALERNDRAVYDFCLRHGYRYGDRLHIRIFDTTVGV